MTLRAVATLAGLALIAAAALSPPEFLGIIERDWMKAGLLAAPLALTAAWVVGRGKITVPVLGLIVLAAYLIHQAEEHWIDALGRTYAFRDFANATIASRFPQGLKTLEPMTPLALFVINAGVWLIGLQGVLSRAGDAFPLAASAAVTLVNGIAHIASAIALGIYNPGLVTAILLFVPIAGGTLAWLWRTGNATGAQVAAAIAWGIGGHAILIAAVLGANGFGLFPEIAGLFAILFWMILPTAFAGAARTQR